MATPLKPSYVARHLKPSLTLLDSVAEESDVGAGSKGEGVRVLPKEQALQVGRDSAVTRAPPLHRRPPSPSAPSEREKRTPPAIHQRHHRLDFGPRSFSPAPSEPPGATLAPHASRRIQEHK